MSGFFSVFAWWFSPVEILQRTSIVQDSETFWWMTCLWFPWSSKGYKLFLPSFLTKTSLGSDYVFVVSLAAGNLYAGFAFPHHFSIIWFSSLYQSPYAVLQHHVHGTHFAAGEKSSISCVLQHLDSEIHPEDLAQTL